METGLRFRFELGLVKLHPEKTKLVQTENMRREVVDKNYPESLKLSGHQFRKQPTKVKDGSIKLLYGVTLAPKARKKKLEELKYEKLHKGTDSIERLAQGLHAKESGWIAYYGK